MENSLPLDNKAEPPPFRGDHSQGFVQGTSSSVDLEADLFLSDEDLPVASSPPGTSEKRKHQLRPSKAIPRKKARKEPVAAASTSGVRKRKRKEKKPPRPPKSYPEPVFVPPRMIRASKRGLYRRRQKRRGSGNDSEKRPKLGNDGEDPSPQEKGPTETTSSHSPLE